MAQESKTLQRAKAKAFSNPDLMPVDCIDILKDEYGERLECMKPLTIFEMIRRMMGTVSDADLTDEIIEEVNDYVKS